MSIIRVLHRDETTEEVTEVTLEHDVDNNYYPTVNPIAALDPLHEKAECNWCDIIRHNMRMTNGIDSGYYAYDYDRKQEKMRKITD